jgi:hypothetical protein
MKRSQAEIMPMLPWILSVMLAGATPTVPAAAVEASATVAATNLTRLPTDQVTYLRTTSVGTILGTNTAWVPGTLACELVSNIQTRTSKLGVSGPAITNYLTMFTNWWFCLNGYGRNTNFWLGDCAGYSAACVWNSNPDSFMINHTAISPRHVLTANHCAAGTNVEIRFCTRDGLLVTNHIIDGIQIRNVDLVDLWVGLLASNLPPSVEVAQVVPANFSRYFSSASANDLLSQVNGLLLSCHERWMWPPAAFNHGIRGGDSGSPIYVLVGTNLVLYSILSGAAIAPNFTQIQSTMHTLSTNHAVPPYHLTTIDLSQFPAFR